MHDILTSFREYSTLKEALNYRRDKILWSTNLSQPLSSAIAIKAQRHMCEMYRWPGMNQAPEPSARTPTYRGWSSYLHGWMSNPLIMGANNELLILAWGRMATWCQVVRSTTLNLFHLPILPPSLLIHKHSSQEHCLRNILHADPASASQGNQPVTNVCSVSRSMLGELHLSFMLFFTTPCEIFSMVLPLRVEAGSLRG